jgi:tRNA(Arg) A34 adenosine deaminase TadA
MRGSAMLDERPVPPSLGKFWNSTVHRFATLDPLQFEDWEKERHRIYSLLLMAMVYAKWNGNKFGEVGDYGHWRANQLLGNANGRNFYDGGSYLGHNIAALAVDAEGRIMDFDFNHNAIFDSTVEHAESRLVRRLFALNQIYSPWETLASEGFACPDARRTKRPYQGSNIFATAVSDRPAPRHTTPPTAFATLLKDVTIYTSLESCAQCSGIMCLADVKDVVYLQWDQGQFLIGNIMRQATFQQDLGFLAPRPIRGDEFGFAYFTKLNEANDEFSCQVAASPFFRKDPHDPTPVIKPSVTSFLCTDRARSIYHDAQEELVKWTQAKFPDAKPQVANAFTNQEVLTEAHDFRDWFTKLDNRGTPHRV